MPRINYHFIYPVSIKKKAKHFMRQGLSQSSVKERMNLNSSLSTIGRWRYQKFDSRSLKQREEKKVCRRDFLANLIIDY